MAEFKNILFGFPLVRLRMKHCDVRNNSTTIEGVEFPLVRLRMKHCDMPAIVAAWQADCVSISSASDEAL